MSMVQARLCQAKAEFCHRSKAGWCGALAAGRLHVTLALERSNAGNAAYPAADDEAAASSGCGLAPLISSHNMVA